jgi:hypothetical protein
MNDSSVFEVIITPRLDPLHTPADQQGNLR